MSGDILREAAIIASQAERTAIIREALVLPSADLRFLVSRIIEELAARYREDLADIEAPS